MAVQELDVEVGDRIIIERPEGTLALLVRDIDEVDGRGAVEFELIGINGWQVISDGKIISDDGSVECTGLPRFWQILGFGLSQETRKCIFDPMFSEFLEDYLFASKKFRRKRDHCLLSVVFTWRTIKMTSLCYKIEIGAIGTASAYQSC